MYWLWVVNFAGAVLIVIRVWFVGLGRRPKVIDMQRTMLKEVAEKVRNLPSRNELLDLWRAVPPAAGAEGSPHVIVRLIWFLHQAEGSADDAVRRLDDACKRYVDICNTSLAVRIDDGLLNATRFVRSRPELHEELVRSIPLIEPLIWYKSLVRGMGRWGYRVLALHAVLDSLRVSASRPEIKSELRDVVTGNVMVVQPRISWPRLMSRRVAFIFVAPTISVRVKLRQRRRAVELAKALRALNIDLPDPEAVAW
jgi:hypothetical protein